jgi:hypothetical protein
MHGGVSHVDTFDPKPELDKRHGQPLPGKGPVSFSAGLGTLMKSPWKFRNYGQSGQPVSDLFPHIGSVVDEIAVVRSMKTQNVAHAGAVIELHTGSGQFIRPSVGSWVLYGLGSENASLPGFISFGPPDFQGGSQNYGSAFLPATFQGTAVGNHLTPIARSRINNLDRAEPTDSLPRKQPRPDPAAQPRPPASSRPTRGWRPASSPTSSPSACRGTTPEAMDVSREPDKVLGMYGIDGGPTDNFGRQCLMARRLVERGVRFVQCNHSYKWDQHAGLVGVNTTERQRSGPPIAALVKDLKQRGLLDETLIVWGTEFGRTPVGQGGDGRDHNPYGFSDVAGRRRGQGRHGLRGDRRVRLPRRRERHHHARPARHHPAPARVRPHEAHLPARRPGLPADRRSRRGREGDPCVRVSGLVLNCTACWMRR